MAFAISLELSNLNLLKGLVKTQATYLASRYLTNTLHAFFPKIKLFWKVLISN